MTKQRGSLGFFQRRECIVPTWRGWLAILCLWALAAFTVMKGVYPFLCVNDSLPGGILVVEGWAPEGVLSAALAEWKRHHYDKLYVTGGPIDDDSPLAEFKTWANLGGITLTRFGADGSYLESVPSPFVVKDRTYASATSLKKRLREHGPLPDKINLVSLGPHSRRSRLLFQMAFEGDARVGIISIEDSGFEPARWWKSSGGVRAIVGESIAYLYARFIFRPPANE